MKKKHLLTFACVVWGAISAQAQIDPMRYELKTNGLAFAFGEINILYESPVKQYTSINLFAGHLFSDNTSQTSWGNWSYIGGTYRFYQKENHHGIYFGPFVKYRVQYASRDVLVLDPVTLDPQRTTVRSFDSNMYLGLEIGTKGRFNDVLLYEVFAGAGRPLASWNNTGFNAENEFGAVAHYRVGILLNYRWTK
jgi:hypothetical protein